MGDPGTLTTTMTCPTCREKTVVTMPTTRFDFYWECPKCRTLLETKSGDCCVYVSFGNTLCPFLQARQRTEPA